MKKYVIMLFWILLLFLVSCVSTESVFSQATIVTDAQNQELAQEIETIEIKETEIATPIVNLLPDGSPVPSEYDSYGYEVSPIDIYNLAECFEYIGELNGAYRLYSSIKSNKLSNQVQFYCCYKKWSKYCCGLECNKNDLDSLLSISSQNGMILVNRWMPSYKIGDVGPAGGFVFYDKGDYIGGWRYLEAAPEDLSGKYMWGDSGFYVEQKEIGTGKENTKIIIENSSTNRPNNAAKACDDYEVNGYSDWFLPSYDEINLMYKNLKNKGIGGFCNNCYWSSSGRTDHSNEATYRSFHTDREIEHYNWTSRSNVCYVRACRAF